MNRRIIAQTPGGQTPPGNNMAMPTNMNNPGGMASIPGGPANIPLGSGGEAVDPQGGAAAPAAPTGLTPDEVLPVMQKIANSAPSDVQEYQGQIEDFWHRASNAEMKNLLQSLLGAIHMNKDPKRITINPSTNEPDPTAPELAQKIIEEVNNMNKAEGAQKNAGVKAYNLKTAGHEQSEQHDKKKTRGNPFRVLMGQVGKLLDHGMETRDIVRFLLKKKYWNEETISKAVEIVKQYNRKEHIGEKNLQKDKIMDKHQPDKKSSPAFHHPQNNADHGFKPNFASYNNAQRTVTAADKTIYDAEPEWSKRSTAELMARAAWLMSLDEYDEKAPHGDGRKAADKKGVTAQLKAIRAALKERGFDPEEIK